MDGLLKPSAAIIAAPILAYALGYVYFVAYFNVFTIDIKTVAIPLEHYFVHGVIVFLGAMLPENLELADFVAPVSALVVCAGLVLPLQRWRGARAIVVALFAIPLLGAATVEAITLAHQDAGDLRATDPVYLTLDGAAGLPAPAGDAAIQETGEATALHQAQYGRIDELLRANQQGELRLAWQDSDMTVVAKSECAAAEDDNCFWRVYRLPTSQVTVTASIGASLPMQGQQGESR